MDYAQFVPPFLAVFGAALQWVRQYKAVHDVWIFCFALVVS